MAEWATDAAAASIEDLAETRRGRKSMTTTSNRRITTTGLALLVTLALFSAHAIAASPAIEKWLDEFTPSTLSPDAQREELEWFIKAAEPFRGMKINVVSETIDTHVYESKILAQAFSELTGIELTHDLIQEGDVVEKLQTQMQSDRNIYDAYINDSDLIGTHFRYGKVVPLSDWMAGQGKDVTLPTLDVDDFIGISFTTAPDGKIYQLPDQQFANLYWFRADWFERPDFKKRFKAKYGYELGVPINWSAYEDIAEFFTNDVKTIDGKRIYGHMDYGKKDPSLGWRFTDAWLVMAGAGDKGLPNGKPVDEWGIRVEGCNPVGSSVERGGAVNGPAAVFATTKYIEWLGGASARPGTHRSTDLLVHGLHRRHDQGWPSGGKRKRHSEVAHGAISPRSLLGGRYETRVSGCGIVDPAEEYPGRAAQGGLAVRPVHRVQNRLTQKDSGWPHSHQRIRYPVRCHDRRSAQAGRIRGVLPQPRPRRLDADRHKRSRLPEAGPAVVAERGRSGEW
jgi:ABC-type glycerol-3-phosphate transport system substrate-binding protein